MAKQIETYHTDKYGNRPWVECFRNTATEWIDGQPATWSTWVAYMCDERCDKYDVIYNCNVRPFLAFQQINPVLPVFHAAVIAYAEGKVAGLIFVSEPNVMTHLLTRFPLPRDMSINFHDFKEKPETIVNDSYVGDRSVLVFLPACPNHEYQKMAKAAYAEAYKICQEQKGKLKTGGWYQLDTPEMKFFIHFESSCVMMEDLMVLVERLDEAMDM